MLLLQFFMRIYFPITLSLLAFHGTIAQISLRDNLNQVYYSPDMYMQTYGVQDGSPYLNTKFALAKINENKKTYLVRFNAYEGKVEVSIDANRVIELTPKETFQIKMLDGSERNYLTTKYRNPKGEVKNSFFEVIHKGEKYTLYAKERINYFKKTRAEAYKEAKPNRFEKGITYFYLGTKSGVDEVLTYLPNKTNKLSQVFSKKNSARIKALVKKEKLNLNSKEGLIQVLDLVY